MFPPPYSLYFTRERCIIYVENVKTGKKLRVRPLTNLIKNFTNKGLIYYR